MEYIKKQKIITNIGGALMLTVVIINFLLKKYENTIICGIISALAYYGWRKFDEVEILKDKKTGGKRKWK